MDIIGTLDGDVFKAEDGCVFNGLDPLTMKKKVVIIDAGFYSEENLKWLTKHQYDYVCVMRSSHVQYKALSDEIVRTKDNRGGEIRLQLIQATKPKKSWADKNVPEYYTSTALLIDSDGKTAKEDGIFEQKRERCEQELEKLRLAIEGKGVKKRDAVQRRIGSIFSKFKGMKDLYTIKVTMCADKPNRAEKLEWSYNGGAVARKELRHGKYIVLTSREDWKDEKAIWDLYNIIREVESTFKVWKSDLKLRPVFHKTDKGTIAHIYLAVLAYWIVSIARRKLAVHGIHNCWSDIVRIASAQQRLTMKVEKADGGMVSVRKSTEPEENLCTILVAMGMMKRPPGKPAPLNFVGAPPSQPPPCSIFDTVET